MRTILISLLLLLSLSLGAYTEYAMSFMQITPSSTCQAMGNGYIGVADVWHSSPLIAWDNPAMPAMHEGIAYGIVKDRPYDDYLEENYPDYCSYTGMMTIGYKGIAVLLPMVNPYGSLGTYFTTGKYNYQQDETGGHGMYNYHTVMYGLSFNPLKYIRETNKQYPSIYDWLDLSAGLSVTDIDVQNWEPFSCKGMYHHNEVRVMDLGMLAYAQKPLSGMLTIDGSLGYKRYNLTRESINETGIDTIPLGQNDVVGLGLGLYIPNKSISKSYPLKTWTENLVTLRVLTGKNHSEIMDKSVSTGIELGLVDTIYLRGGSFSNHTYDNVNDNTWGFGIKLHNNELWTLECNFARMENDYGFKPTNSWDAMFRIDGFRLLEKAITKR